MWITSYIVPLLIAVTGFPSLIIERLNDMHLSDACRRHVVRTQYMQSIALVPLVALGVFIPAAIEASKVSGIPITFVACFSILWLGLSQVITWRIISFRSCDSKETVSIFGQSFLATHVAKAYSSIAVSGLVGAEAYVRYMA